MTPLKKHQQQIKRGNRVRKQIGDGTADKPRLVVFRSNAAITAQIINDTEGKVLASAHSLKEKKAGNIDSAKKVGSEIAKKAKETKVTRVIFDRNGYAFHGRVKALAESAREGGLQF